MSKQGFIMLHRSIQQHWIYDEKRKFSKYEAWLDMLMMANHSESKFVLGNELIELKAGQFVTSIRKLGERWDWSNTKVSQFLDLLKKDEMLLFEKDTKKTLVTIVKYGFYQGKETEEKTQNEHKKDTNRTQKHTNNNVNNDNNENNDKKEILLSAFDEFWKAYPKKVDKKAGEKAFKKACAEHDPQIIIQGAINYAKECQAKGTAKGYIKNPATFLNAESFTNDFDTSYSEGGQARTGGMKVERNTGGFSQTTKTSGRQYDTELPTFDYKQR